MNKPFVLVATSLAMAMPVIARAEAPSKTEAMASWTPIQQWMYGNRDARNDYGYGSLAGALLIGDELGDNFSELGRVSMVGTCLKNLDANMKSTFSWAMCGPDAKAIDMKKLEAELAGADAATRESILKEAKEIQHSALAIGAVVEAAAKDDPGLQKFLKITDAAKAEWAAYIGKHKADFDRYVALKDGVRSAKSNNKVFAGCWEATQPAFAKLVKATAPKVPWEVGNDYLPGYMKYMTATTEGYIASVAFAACAWSTHESGEGFYVSAANQDFGGHIHAGWRTIALAMALDPELKPKFADRSLQLETFQWKYGVKMTGVNEILAIQTPSVAAIGKITKKDDTTTSIRFKGDKVEECLQWKDTNKVAQVTGGSVSYEKVCVKRGMVDNDEGTVELATKFAAGLRPGDQLAVVGGFPVVSWKDHKLTTLLGVALK